MLQDLILSQVTNTYCKTSFCHNTCMMQDLILSQVTNICCKTSYNLIPHCFWICGWVGWHPETLHKKGHQHEPKKTHFGDISYNVFNGRKSSYLIIKPLDFIISCRMDHFSESNHQQLIFFVYFLIYLQKSVCQVLVLQRIYKVMLSFHLSNLSLQWEIQEQILFHDKETQTSLNEWTVYCAK